MTIFPSFFVNTTGGGYEIEQSLRFNSADTHYLNRTPSSAGNRKTWTWSGWVKRTTTTLGVLSSCYSASSNNGNIDFGFRGDDQGFFVVGWTTTWRRTTQVFRDPSAWYHIVLAVDTTQATADNRLKIYVNGTEVTSFSILNNPPQNEDLGYNQASTTAIGSSSNAFGNFFNGYLAEVNFIDGSALDPTDFGEFDESGVWRPIKYAGSYTGNSFYLKFASGDGTDSSGLSNTWTANNFTTSGTGTDVMSDTPTTNYCTLNPLFKHGNSPTISNGNLTAQTASGDSTVLGTHGITSGKYYFEGTLTSGSGGGAVIGVLGGSESIQNTSNTLGFYPNAFAYYIDGRKASNNVYASYGNSYTTSDVIGVAIDADNGKIFFSKNGTFQNSGDPAAGTNAAYTTLSSTITYLPGVGDATSSNTVTWDLNFGQRAFAYTPPTGYNALNTANLPAPTVKDGTANFNTVLYTGNNSTQTISTNFSPDFVWAKNRDSTGYHHDLYDRVRGDNLRIFSSQNSAETTGYLQFGTNNFSLTSGGGINANGEAHVAWHWLAGGSGSSNTDGSITSTVSANPTAGFSIVSYTGTGANATVGHGLGVAPALVMVKNRDTVASWIVGTTAVSGGFQRFLSLDTTAAIDTRNDTFNNTNPTSTVFSLGTLAGTNNSGDDFIAYCFAEVEGYSKIGSYTGNNSSDGPFIYCGFKPALLIIKSSTSGENWHIKDSTRESYNPIADTLLANAANSEFNLTDSMDLLSNGFKIRSNSYSGENSSNTFIFAAFAENPFGGSGVSPATAR